MDKDRAILGGAAIALAVSVKIVPIIILPTLAVYLVRHRRDLLLRTAAGFSVVFLAFWAGPVLTEWHGLKTNVIGYAGIGVRQWGLVELSSSHHATALTHFLIGPGHILAALVASLLPAAFVWLHRAFVIEGIAFSLVTLLILSPAFGVQYLAWALAAAYILNFWLGTMYNVVAGLFLYLVYDYWNHGLPWTHIARGNFFTHSQLNLGLVIWTILGVLAVLQILRGIRMSLSIAARRTRVAKP